MKKFFSFIVLILFLSLLIGCGRDDVDTVSTESEKTSSTTSRVIKKVRQDLLKSEFIFETDDQNKIAILSSPDNITYDNVYGELVKNDDPYIIITAKVIEVRSFDSTLDSGFSLCKIKVTKVHESKPNDAIKVDDNVFIFDCFCEDLIYDTSDSKAVLKFSPTNDNLYYSPLLIEDEEYIFFLADRNRIDKRTLNKADPGHNYFYYNHAAFGLNFEYIEQYPENITTEALIKTFAEGKISKKTFFYQLHKDVLDKFNK